jgi:hypothetical protein
MCLRLVKADREAEIRRRAAVLRPKEVNMRSKRTKLLVLALVAIVLTAWAGDNAVVDKPKSQKDNGATVAPAQPASEEEKPDQATQPTQDQAPESRDRSVQAPERRSDNAQPARSEPSSARAPQYRSEPAQAPASVERQEPSYTEPTRIQTRQSDRSPGNDGEINVPQPNSEPNRGGRRGGSGGYRGGRDHDPFDRRPTHYFGGRGWHGRHDEWRHNRFHGSWRFLFYLGPTIYYPPIHYPHVIRIPHDRVGVYVRYTGDDVVGSAFAESVREQLRDQGLRVVYSQDDARLELYIISMEQDPDDPGYNSSISVSYVWYPGHKFITAQMVDAGLNQVDDLAASVAAYADDLVDDYR